MLELDRKLFLLLNSLHAEGLDTVMLWITSKYTWIPFYVALLVFLIIRYKKRVVPVLLSILLSITLSDQICSSLLKPWVARLRPCHEPSLASLMHLVGSCGGQYGFCSSHAANSFSLAMSLVLLFPKQKLQHILLFVWATVVSYSRIYVGVHYPLDVLAGAIIGMTSAFLFFKIFSKNISV